MFFKKKDFVLYPRVHFYFTGVPGKFIFNHKGSAYVKEFEQFCFKTHSLRPTSLSWF